MTDRQIDNGSEDDEDDFCCKCSCLRFTRSKEGMDSENTLAEKEYDVRDLIYSLGPMHLLHVDVGKIYNEEEFKQRVSEWREQIEP